MAVLTVRNLDPDVKTRLRVQATQQGIAMKKAVRHILTRAANEPPATSASNHDLGQRIQARFSGLGEFHIAPRRSMRAPPFASDSAAK